MSDDHLPNVEAWTQSEISRQEKEAVGFYLSVHPLDDYRQILTGLNILNIADHKEINAGDSMALAGIVSGLQVKYSKKGNRYCSFRLEDKSTGVKCLAWAEAYEKYSGLLANDALLIVEGRVKSAEGQEITYIVNDVKSLNDAQPRNASAVSIGLPKGDYDEAYFYDLLSILGRSQGKCEVFLNFPIDDLAVKLNSQVLRIQGSRTLENDLKAKGCSVNWLL